MTARARCSDLALKNPIGTTIELAPGSTVGVYAAGTAGTGSEAALAQTLYAGKTGGTTKANPFTVAGDGSFVFYVTNPDICDLKVTLPAGAGTNIIQYVPILHDPADLESRLGYVEEAAGRLRRAGVVGDCIQTRDPILSNGSAVLFSGTAAFVPTDVGKTVRVTQLTLDATTHTWSAAIILGGSTGATITGYTSATTVTVSVAATAATVYDASHYGLMEYGHNDTTALQSVLNAGGLIWLTTASRYMVTGTLYLGDGSATANSTIQNVQIFGASSRIAADVAINTEEGLIGFPQIVWCGPVGGTVMRVRGPIQNCRIEHIGFDCGYIAGQALQTLDYQHSSVVNCKAVRYIDAALDIQAYSYGDAGSTYPPTLISALGSAHILIDRWLGFSQSASAIGISLGQGAIPAMPPLTDPFGIPPGVPLAAGFGPDLHEFELRGCLVRQGTGYGVPYASCGIGLRIRFADAGSLTQCSFVARETVRIDPPTSATSDASAKGFPNAIELNWIFLDDGGNGAWDKATINGTWTSTHKLQQITPHSLASGGAPSASFGWGMTALGGFTGDWTFNHDLAVNNSLTVGASIGAGGAVVGGTGLVATTGGVTATAGNVTATAGDVKAGARVYIGTVVSPSYYIQHIYFGTLASSATIDLDTRMGSLKVINVGTGEQCEVLLTGAVHTVVQKSNSITGFILTDTGSTIAIYWDGIDSYRIRNRTAGNAVLRVVFEGQD